MVVKRVVPAHARGRGRWQLDAEEERRRRPRSGRRGGGCRRTGCRRAGARWSRRRGRSTVQASTTPRARSSDRAAPASTWVRAATLPAGTPRRGGGGPPPPARRATPPRRRLGGVQRGTALALAAGHGHEQALDRSEVVEDQRLVEPSAAGDGPGADAGDALVAQRCRGRRRRCGPGYRPSEPGPRSSGSAWTRGVGERPRSAAAGVRSSSGKWRRSQPSPTALWSRWARPRPGGLVGVAVHRFERHGHAARAAHQLDRRGDVVAARRAVVGHRQQPPELAALRPVEQRPGPAACRRRWRCRARSACPGGRGRRAGRARRRAPGTPCRTPRRSDPSASTFAVGQPGGDGADPAGAGEQRGGLAVHRAEVGLDAAVGIEGVAHLQRLPLAQHAQRRRPRARRPRGSPTRPARRRGPGCSRRRAPRGRCPRPR